METTIKVLLLEDNATDADIVEMLLKKEMPKCEIKCIMHQHEYIEELNNFKPDIILADYALPQFTAIEALEILHQKKIAIPLIVISGVISEDFALYITKLGAADYILKDRIIRLPAAIQSALEKQHLENDKIKAQENLLQSEKKYRNLFERNLAGIYQATTKGEIITCNDAFINLLGFPSLKQLKEENINLFAFTNKNSIDFLGKLFKNRSLNNLEIELINKKGEIVYAIENCTLQYNTTTDEPIIEGILLDITERKKTDTELEKSYKAIRKLTNHLQNIREEERITASKEIHDEIGNALTIIKSHITWLQKNLTPQNDEVIDRISKLHSLVNSTILSVKQITAKLHPGILDTLGIIAAIDWQIKKFEKSSNIRTNFKVTESVNPELPKKIKNILFRILEESLYTVASRLYAKTVNILLEITPTKILLEIQDDGIGFIESDVPKEVTLSILNMNEMITGIGGQFFISGKPGKGTIIEVIIATTQELMNEN